MATDPLLDFHWNQNRIVQLRADLRLPDGDLHRVQERVHTVSRYTLP